MNTTVLTALVKMSVFLHFSFLLFFQFPFFQRCFLTGFQKTKNNKIAKQEEQTTTTRKQDAKQKEMKCYDSKEHKTTSRTTKTKEHLETKKANTTKRKSKNQKEKMRSRKEGRKKRTRERQRKRKGNLGGRPPKG